MKHKAYDLSFNKGTSLDVIFQNGEIKRYDMSVLFSRYPQLKALKDRTLFTSGKLMGASGIVWNDELDISVETIYQDGEYIGMKTPAPCMAAADAVRIARARADISQKELASLTGMDQADISKLERGFSNPSIATLNKIAKALNGRLVISIEE